MIISFYGAAGDVTGSKHLITLENKKRILLDCGIFQGKNSEKLNKDFLFEAASIDYLILSHAHMDHSGLIPLLYKKGFTGKIFATDATFELTQLLLSDSLKIQNSNYSEDEGESLPIFNKEDLEKALSSFHLIGYNTRYKIDESIELLFQDAGHILGSASVHLTIKEKETTRTLCFTGDLGRYSNRILCPPQPQKEAEIVICESTYGDSLHQSIETTEQLLEKIVKDVCLNRGGKLLVPAFSIGRTQELIFSLNKLAEDGKLGDIQVFVDSPLSVYATSIVGNHPELFNKEMQEYLKNDPDPFGFRHLKYIEDHEESLKLVTSDIPAVIISSSGMMDAGRIVNHLKENLGKPECGILVTGYSAPGTLGNLITKGEKVVYIHNEKIEVKAEVFKMQEYSAHGDYGDILKFLSHIGKDVIKNIFLVHGEPKTMRKLKIKLLHEGFKGIEIAKNRISYEV